MVGDIYHSGFISSVHKDTLDPWTTTTDNNEVIEFKDTNGNVYKLNSLVIYSNDDPLYIRILPSEYCVYIPPHDYLEYNFCNISSIQILANAGVEYRYYGFYS